ncbi:MAG: hypothetical protein IPL53_25180 [Ignavibacteria bacterium]|nr:hypothetical protein [Ignavibacteria bacterium]
MKKALTVILILVSGLSFSQDLLINNNPYDQADEITKNRNSFKREKWFYEQRMYPNNYIPKDAYRKAYEQKEKLNSEKGFAMMSPFDTWTNIGPTTGFYFSYSNITSRMVTVKYDPNDGNTIYIGGAFGGVWKSTNSGATWTAKSDNEVSLSSGSIAIDPANSNIIYYGTGEATYSGASYYGRGLLKSTDGGNTWISITSGLPSSSYTSRIVIRPNNSDQLLAAMGIGGLYRSTNAGVNWTQLVSGRCDDVIFSPTGDTAYIVGSGTGYRISTNGGSSFTANGSISMGTRNHIALCRTSPNILYYSNYTGSSITVFKSVTAGFSFSQIAVGQNFSGSQAWYDFYMHVNPFDPNYAYVGSIDVWRTTNGGSTNFTNITNGYSGGGVHVDQQNMDFHPTDPNQMLCVNDGGIWKSTNRGTSWINQNTNQTLTQFYRIAADPSNANHILGGTQDNGTQRTLGALNWSAAFGGDGAEVCFHAKNNSYILGESQNNGVQRSSNGGASWSSGTSGLSGTASWVAPILSHPDSATIFYTARQTVFKTTNWGASWFTISTGTGGTIREMAISKSSANIMYATSGASIYKSTNRGYTYASVTNSLPARTITSVNVHPDSSQVVVITFSGFDTGHIYKTTNGGTTWTNISGDLPNSPANDAFIFYPGMPTGSYYIATDVGVFVTSNYGQSWTELANGLPNTVAMHLDYHQTSNKLRLGTHGRGVFEIQLSIPPMQIQISTIPEGFYNTLTGQMNMKDTVRSYLRNNSAPFTIADSAYAKIDSVTFTANFVFQNANSGTYYLMMKHRNSIETWSKAGGEALTRGFPNNYDFTNSITKAYGNNLSQVGTEYCNYSGDIDQSGVVDLSDILLAYNDVSNFTEGFVNTDVTGNGIVDLNDLLLTHNNAAKLVEVVRP